uniref:Uncharacterized protein n=1 Tax=Panagrolaimus sp. JU765 TaxID=591449 RepID=A0AC34PWJ4_9BILA
MVTVETIENKLKKGLETEYVFVKDQSDGCGAKFEIIAASDKFQGMPIIKRHRLIHQICDDEFKLVHAMTMHTYSMEEYNKSVEFQIPKKKVLDEMQEM